MQSLPPDDLVRITDYVAGELSAEAAAETERWIAEDGGRQALADDLERSRDSLRRSLDARINYARILRGIEIGAAPEHSATPKVHASEHSSQSDSSGGKTVEVLSEKAGQAKQIRLNRHSRSVRPFRIYAAALVTSVVLLLTGILVRDGIRNQMPVQMAEQTYSTRPGQQAEVTLSDGSKVTMASATTLRTSISTATQAMTVVVDGEAFFRIVHRPHVAFTVRTRNAITRVLGTQFSVRQYADDRTTQVVVADGRVSLRSMRYPAAVGTVMAARTLGTVDDSGRVDVTPNVAVDEYTAWTTGQLVFRQAPAREIAAGISRVYGIQIHITDTALAQHVLTWSIPVTQVTLAEALEAFVAALNAHVVRSGDTITVVPGRTTPTRLRNRDSHSTREHTYGR
jgi:ferric-dicitrate binding protein FerR (iron transport regulator)